MLSDSNYKFVYKGNNYFEEELSKITKDGSCSIEAIIIYYLKNKNGKVDKVIRKYNTDINDIDIKNKEVISKYYITKFSFDMEPFIGIEYDTMIKIYNIGNFKILADREDQIDSLYDKSNNLFKEYDKNYNKLTFPFTDEEFLNKNTKVLGLNYDGLFIR